MAKLEKIFDISNTKCLLLVVCYYVGYEYKNTVMYLIRLKITILMIFNGDTVTSLLVVCSVMSDIVITRRKFAILHLIF